MFDTDGGVTQVVRFMKEGGQEVHSPMFHNTCALPDSGGAGSANLKKKSHIKLKTRPA